MEIARILCKTGAWSAVMFKIDEEKLNYIAKEFDIEVKYVQGLYNEYTKIHDGMKEQYLAHITRTMEVQLQKLTGNPLFKIVIEPITVANTIFTARAQYQKNHFFLISYPSHLNDIQLRVYLAHELGHLYLIEFLNNVVEGVNLTENSKTEPLSTLFGIFAILDKNDFYATLKERQLLHKTWKAVIDDFKLLANRNKGIFNNS